MVGEVNPPSLMKLERGGESIYRQVKWRQEHAPGLVGLFCEIDSRFRSRAVGVFHP